MSMATVIHMDKCMPTDAVPTGLWPSEQALAQLRLMQLISPALPIGGFAYSRHRVRG